MDKKKRSPRFLKNKIWKTKFAHRLKGRAKDVCQEFWNGSLDSLKTARPLGYIKHLGPKTDN